MGDPLKVDPILAAWRERNSPAVANQVGALWGKSDAGGSVNLLVQHLLDTVAVAELMWDRFLAPSLRRQVDAVSDGRGRALWAWLCGVHDVGKATPAFQHQEKDLAPAVRRSGLSWGDLPIRANQRWRHERASARIVKDATEAAGWDRRATWWVWPLQAGHHGRFCAKGELRPEDRELHGRSAEWGRAQEAVLDLVTVSCGFSDLAAVEPTAAPPRAVQLAVGGLIIMADWIASDETHFTGIDELSRVSLEEARRRATRSWTTLGLRGGWGVLPQPGGDVIRSRFGFSARQAQQIVIDAARALPAPGLLLVEAPMGEGKTEAALAAAEILASRFGADGLFVGMPTQATSDPMFVHACGWAEQIAPGIQVALLHGNRRLNRRWRDLASRRPAAGLPLAPDPYGMDDAPPSTFNEVGVEEGDEAYGVEAAVEWLQGRKRGLLAPVVVGTIDQLLFAATRTKHVSLRYAGLAGKVVVIDEVHAADLYMSQFLYEALFWLGQGGVPVVLLSATLPPDQRRDLMTWYLRGASGDVRLELDELDSPPGYPSVTAAWAADGGPQHAVTTAPAWRDSLQVDIDVLDEPADDAITGVVDHVVASVADGGCVLVLRNTVCRAQHTFRALRELLPSDQVVLLHGRLSAGGRARMTDRLLSDLGPAGQQIEGNGRPRTLIVVATQVAEQSFDVDVDLLVTDVAPIDLLLQRAGRLHRHDRPPDARPVGLSRPRMVITGLHRQPDGPPVISRPLLFVYGENRERGGRASDEDDTPYRGAVPLLRTAALVEQAEGASWSVPAQVPELVAAVYSDAAIVPSSWRDAEALELTRAEKIRALRKDTAQGFVLAAGGERTKPALDGLHRGATGGGADEEDLAAAVRDGERSAELLLVRHEEGRYRSLDRSTDLGVNGEGIHDEDKRDAIFAGTVRLPAQPRLTRAAENLECPVAEWRSHPWTKHAHVLALNAEGSAELAGQQVRYDHELGLQLGDRPDSPYPASAGTT
ncbi:MAG: CRISPR-associated helicase Cas3' [Euzebyales bacterium]|nr:CRISPR-associated helicase Cas3' [Euzebyales bacterium]